MKSFVKKMSLLAVLTVSGLALAGCQKKTSTSAGSEFEQSFVAVTSSTWDAEVAFNNKKNYKLALNLAKDNSFKLTGTYSSEVAQTGGGMGPMGANTQTAATSAASTSVASTSVVPADPFTVSGTWSLEKGYGYILNFIDSKNTVVHVDYNKIQGRHEFYYLCTPDATLGTETVFMQAKDSEFRKSLATDYKTWDERDSTYTFTGTGTGNNNSVAYVYLYMHSDNSVVINTPSGSSRSVTLGGTWTEDKTNHKMTMTLNDKDYAADYSVNASHPAYRMSYSSYTVFASLDSSISWTELTNADFDGETKYAFTGSYTTQGPDGGEKKVSLNLTVLNTAYLYTGTTLTKSGTYTFAGDVFTATFKDNTSLVSTKDGTSYVMTYSFEVSS